MNPLQDEMLMNQEIKTNLSSIQQWFGETIGQPLIDNYLIQSYSSKGTLVAEEAASYIIPSPTLQPHQRMQIYNQQYWWRLYNTLHANFPLLTRLFGRASFNEKIATPFLLKYPPNHWSLNCLGDSLPHWIEENYQFPDQAFVLNAAKLDEAFASSSIAAKYAPLDLKHLLQFSPELIMTIPLNLQPHIHLFSWNYDLFLFRKSMLEKDFDAWVKEPFPKLKKGEQHYFILYRNKKNNIAWREVKKGEYALLQQFSLGKNIETACEYLEEHDSTSCEEIENDLVRMFREWAQLEWIYSDMPHNDF